MDELKEKQNIDEQKSTITSIYDYIKVIMEKQAKFAYNTLLFRGQSNQCYELIPSIARGHKMPCDISIFNEERNLIEMAKYYMPDIFKRDLLPLDLLALLQHYGIPTRLLDVTENPLVALYFACNDCFDKDGEIFVFRYQFSGDIVQYPIIHAIADSYKFLGGAGSWLDLCDFYRMAEKQQYFLESRYLCERIYEGLTKEEMMIQKDKEYASILLDVCREPLFVMASFLTLRQTQQKGRYILFPNAIQKDDDDSKDARFINKIDPIDKNHTCIVQKITVLSKYKKQIISDLNLLGINEFSLFGDSIDKVCHFISEKYKNRNIIKEIYN